MPYASHTILPSGAVSAVRPSALTVSRTRLTSVLLLVILFLDTTWARSDGAASQRQVTLDVSDDFLSPSAAI